MRAVNRVQLHWFDQIVHLVFLDVLPEFAQAALQAEGDRAWVDALLEHGDDFGVMRYEIHDYLD